MASVLPLVLPGQPLYISSASAPSAVLTAGAGAFERETTIYSSTVGRMTKREGRVTVVGKEERSTIPETGSTVSRRCHHHKSPSG